MEEDVVGVMQLDQKVQEMQSELAKLREVLQAKEAVLEDVLCSINRLPRHPSNTALIQNILNSRIKQPESVLDGFECHLAWTVLFGEHICIAIEVHNDTSQIVLPSCAAFSGTDLSDTTTVIFDDLRISQHIPPKSDRTLVVSFQKGLLLAEPVTVVLDCEILNLDRSGSSTDLALLPLLPVTDRTKQSQVVKIFDVNEPLRKYSLARVNDLSLKEGLKLYQCLYCCCYSTKLLDIPPSRLRAILREIGKFTETDFGDWQLFIGEIDTLWSDFIIYVSSAPPAQNRIFARSVCDVSRMTRILIENGITSRVDG